MEVRKLKNQEVEEESETNTVTLPRPKVIKTSQGQYGEVEPDGFDLKLLDKFTPYREEEELPAPIIKVNKKGVRFLHKKGEPRFFFQGNEFIEVYRGLSGKKTRLFWMYKEKNKDGTPNKLNMRIRKYLRNKGFPGA